MKKFISCVMAAAMVASLVPATAFAVSENGDVKATAKVINAWSVSKLLDAGNKVQSQGGASAPEIQLDITSVNYKQTMTPGKTDQDLKQSFNLILDNADWIWTNEADFIANNISIVDKDGVDIIGDWDANATPPTPETGAFQTAGLTADMSNQTNAEAVYDHFIGLSATDQAKYFLYDTTDDDDKAKAVGMSSLLVKLNVGDTDPSKTVKSQMEKLLLEIVGSTDQGSLALWEPVSGKQTMDGKVDGFECTGADANATNGSGGSGAGVVGDFLPIGTNAADNTTGLPANVKSFDDLTVGKIETAAEATTKSKTATVDKMKALTTPVAAANAGYGTWAVTTPGVAGNGAYTGAPKNNAQGRVGDIEVDLIGTDEIKVTVHGRFKVDDIIAVNLESIVDKANAGKVATVSVDSDMVTADDLAYVSVLDRDITASIKKVENVAEEEKANIHKNGLKITSKVDDFANGQVFELKLSKGFEFSKIGNGTDYTIARIDDDKIEVTYTGTSDEFTIDSEDLEIEATSAKSGATAVITVKAIKDKNNANTFAATTTVEVMKVVDYKVVLSVDEDEDLPVIYSGVNTDNYGITDNSDHWSVEVTAEETFPGAWSMRKGFNFELPEHIHVIDVEVKDTSNFLRSDDTATAAATPVDKIDVYDAFFDAYQNGSHLNFEFKKRVFDDVDAVLNRDEATMTFKLQLTADPGFEGDVTLKLTGELVDEQEVTIAKFVKPYEVKAEQNDIIIDYRYTDIPTAITITEAEAGLWAKDEATFYFTVEKGVDTTFMSFEDDPTFEVDSKSDLELKKAEANNGTIEFTVKAESDEAATVTIKDMQLFMNRSIPAGPYDLDIDSTLERAFLREPLFAPDCVDRTAKDTYTNGGVHADANDATDDDCIVDDIDDYSTTVKEAFVNVVTAGRDVDDASFTTKVVVPVGENYIVAGEKQIELDTPAYINAAGYTMLPIRAVAVALGINSNNVLWDQPTKTVTILYGQRIITMTQGQKVVYVNGSAIPASAAVENTNSRTFLPMRDLATALGVTDITWDQATRTATLNGNQK